MTRYEKNFKIDYAYTREGISGGGVLDTTGRGAYIPFSFEMEINDDYFIISHDNPAQDEKIRKHLTIIGQEIIAIRKHNKAAEDEKK